VGSVLRLSTKRAGNGGPGEPIALPGTEPVYTFNRDGEYLPVTPYNDLTIGSLSDAAQWPGVLQRPIIHLTDQDNQDGLPAPSYPATPDMVDWDVGGRPGLVNRLPYGRGVVDTNTVENFALTGRQIKLRRQPENQWGPVKGARSGGSDFSGGLFQQAIPNVPDWLAQSGIAEVY
jgi:hypothetical protein